MAPIRIPANGWKPREYQMPAWRAWERGVFGEANGTLRSLLVWHRRAGKDELALHQIAVAAHIRPANYWHCLPEYEQAKKAIWEAVNPHTGRRRIDEAFPLEVRKRTDNSSMVIEFKSGALYRIVGSDNPDSLVGAAPAGLVFSEWALSNPSVWPFLEPILIENKGWASFIGTPRGRNHMRSMLRTRENDPRWFCQVLTVDDTKAMSLEAIEDARLGYVDMFGQEAADALIEQEYWCSFEAAILGAYYGKEMSRAEREGRIRKVPAWPNTPVHTAWDLGASRGGNTMAIWLFQIVPASVGRSAVRVLAFITASGMSVPWFAVEVARVVDELRDEMREEFNDQKAELPRGTDWVPHDARVPEMTSSGLDGKAKLRIEVMRECRLNPKVVTRHHVADGISALRQLFPRLWFDEKRCSPTGLEALRQYQTEWDDDAKKFKDAPAQTWATHPADAARYMAVAVRDVMVQPQPVTDKILAVNAGGGVNQVTLNELWDMQKRRAGAGRI